MKMFNCMCGKSFIGTVRDFDQHLHIECPVFREARAILEKKS